MGRNWTRGRNRGRGTVPWASPDPASHGRRFRDRTAGVTGAPRAAGATDARFRHALRSGRLRSGRLQSGRQSPCPPRSGARRPGKRRFGGRTGETRTGPPPAARQPDAGPPRRAGRPAGARVVPHLGVPRPGVPHLGVPRPAARRDGAGRRLAAGAVRRCRRVRPCCSEEFSSRGYSQAAPTRQTASGRAGKSTRPRVDRGIGLEVVRGKLEGCPSG